MRQKYTNKKKEQKYIDKIYIFFLKKVAIKDDLNEVIKRGGSSI